MKRVTVHAVFDVEKLPVAEEKALTEAITLAVDVGSDYRYDPTEEGCTLREYSIEITDAPKVWEFGAHVTPEDCPQGEFWIQCSSVDEYNAGMPATSILVNPPTEEYEHGWDEFLEYKYIDHTQPYRLVWAKEEEVR